MKIFNVLATMALTTLLSTTTMAHNNGNRHDHGGRGGDRGGHRGGHRGPHHRHPDYRPGYPYPVYPTYPYNPGYSSGTYYGDVSCSPEVKQKNVNVLEGTVNELLVNPQFGAAPVLKEALQVINSQKELEARIASYLALVGVDAREPSEIAEFIGARDLAPYVARAQDNLSLTAEQANTLVNALSKNLLNNLNN
jgi:hypothetical protein